MHVHFVHWTLQYGMNYEGNAFVNCSKGPWWSSLDYYFLDLLCQPLIYAKNPLQRYRKRYLASARFISSTRPGDSLFNWNCTNPKSHYSCRWRSMCHGFFHSSIWCKWWETISLHSYKSWILWITVRYGIETVFSPHIIFLHHMVWLPVFSCTFQMDKFTNLFPGTPATSPRRACLGSIYRTRL